MSASPSGSSAPTAVQKRFAAKAGIVGLSVLAFALLLGLLSQADRTDSGADTKDKHVNIAMAAPTVNPLASPNNSAYQAELKSVRQRTDELRGTDLSKARALEREIEESLARIEARSQSATGVATAPQSDIPAEAAALVSQAPAASSGPPDQRDFDIQGQKLDRAAARVSNLKALRKDLDQAQDLHRRVKSLRAELAQVRQAPALKQRELFDDVRAQVNALETAIDDFPIK